jgi:hypothetical protein
MNAPQLEVLRGGYVPSSETRSYGYLSRPSPFIRHYMKKSCMKIVGAREASQEMYHRSRMQHVHDARSMYAWPRVVLRQL